MSNLINHINQIILEARRNPEHNPQISLYENLLKYKGQKDIFVTFKSLEKVGINPRAKWGHTSPVGVYAYPIDHVLSVLRNNIITGDNGDDQFAFDKPYAYALKRTDVPGMRVIDNLLYYSAEDLEKDIQKILDYYSSNLNAEKLKSINKFIKIYTDWRSFEGFDDKSPFEKLWHIVKGLAGMLAKNPSNVVSVATKWNDIFRNCLNISTIYDSTDERLMHVDIWYEMIFLTPEAYKVIEAFNNKNFIYDTAKIFLQLFNKFISENNDPTVTLPNNESNIICKFYYNWYVTKGREDFIVAIEEYNITSWKIHVYDKNDPTKNYSEYMYSESIDFDKRDLLDTLSTIPITNDMSKLINTAYPNYKQAFEWYINDCIRKINY